MIYYARSDYRAYVPPGGVCKGHNKPAIKAKHPITGKIHLSIDCPQCEPHLKNDSSWTSDLESVELTAEEAKKIEAAQAEANRAMGQFGAEWVNAFQDYMKNKK